MGNLKSPKTAQQLKLAPNEGKSDELSLPLSKLPRVKDLKRDALIPVVNDDVTEVTTVDDIAKLAKGDKGDKGDSAYQVWLSAGNTGTMQDYLNSLKGKPGAAGDDGLSAYEVWLSQGNKGSEADYLASLKGDKGDKGDAGGFIDLPNTTDLDTVKAPGGYTVNGSSNWQALHYPFAVVTGNKVMMNVSTVKSGTFDTIIQTFFATNLSNRPGSQVRVLTNSGWSGWVGLADFNYVDTNFVRVPILEQLDLKISETIGDKPTVYSYQKPTNDGKGPNIEFAPSANPGVVISLPWGYRSFNQGSFGGLVLALDSAGDMYVNIDMQRPDDPAAWKKFSFGDGGDTSGVFLSPKESLGAVSLNTITTPGAYYQATPANATTANNYPVNNVIGGLLVYTLGTGETLQIYRTPSLNAPFEYQRLGSKGTWKDWQPSVTTAGRWKAPDAEYTGNLNSLSAPGVYWSKSATTANNWPSAGRGSVIVQATDAYIFQTCSNDDGQYYRYTANGTNWGAWSKTAKMSDIPSAGNWGAPAAGLTGSINGLIGSGSYWAAAEQVTPANGWPVTKFDATLQVYRSGTFVQQICESKYRMMSRYSENSGASWTAWATVALTSDIPARLWWVSDNVDFNQKPNDMTSIADQGIYQFKASDVTLANGFPVANVACTLECKGGRNGNNVQICYLAGNTQLSYQRYRNAAGTGWAPWYPLSTAWHAADDLQRGSINDLRQLANQGVYQFSHSITPITIANGFPFNAVAGERVNVIVLVGFAGGDATQILHRTSQNVIYTRSYVNSWGEWKELGGGVKLDPNVNNLLSNSSDGLLFDRYKAPNVGITGTYVSTGGGPDFTEDDAFSETGGVWRVKNTLMLSRVPAKYSGAVIVDISLGKIPCDSSGIPLQYTLSTTTKSKQVSGVWRQHSVMILAVVGSPVKLMDVASGALEDYKEGATWNVSVKYTFGEMAPSV